MCSESIHGICARGSKFRAAVALAALALAGCRGPQSVLDPKGAAAEAIAQASWIMFAGAAAILTLVMALALLALYRRPEPRRAVSETFMIVAGGVALPVVALSALLAYGVVLTGKLRADPQAQALHIDVVAHQFWWEVRYASEAGDAPVATANELRIPAGRQIVLSLSSTDVIHSFWVPSLAGKIDVIPGRTTRMTLVANQPGTFRGQCAEFCGAQHARMAVLVIASTPEDFDRWLARLRTPARVAAAAAPGREAFLAHECVECHTIRGVASAGRIGPDLTHVASRSWLGAGTLENSPANLRRWIGNAQALKPGSAMPSFAHLDAATLDALAAYLASLE